MDLDIAASNETNVCSQSFDLKSIRRRIPELRNVDENPEFRLEEEEEDKMSSVANELEKRSNGIFFELSSNLSTLSSEDLDGTLVQLKKELDELESENAGVELETVELQNRCLKDYEKMEYELEKLCNSLEFVESQGPENENDPMQIDFSMLAAGQEDCLIDDSKFKMLDLSHQIDEKMATLKSLQDLDYIYKRLEAADRLEDALTGLRVMEVEGNSIRFSLKTYIPYLESVLRAQDVESIESLEVNHELIVKTADGTWEVKSVEIFPNDVHIGEIVDAAKSFRKLHHASPIMGTRSSLEWFVRQVQDRITLSSIRRLLAKKANKSRHSFEYVDREGRMIAHLAGGSDAVIKLPQGWPLTNAPLELISLESKSRRSEISFDLLNKIVDMANSLNEQTRLTISVFVDCIEEILRQQVRSELHADADTSEK